MAGIKIHQYPLERTSIGDDDYYDIDYWTGSSYQSAKIKGSTLKNVLGANYIDIQDFSSGYTLKPTDAGKLITNAGSPFRDLIVDTTLQAPGHGFTVKGRVEIKPALGVNIDLPDGTTITNPSSFICGSESFYVLQRKGFTGTNWILVEVKKSENLATNDLIITDTIRELQVATGGTFQIVTNDPNNSAIFRVGENSNERFSEIEFNTVIFDLVSKFQNPSITAGVIVEVNPNEFKFIVLPDTSNTSVYHGLINADANKTIIEKSNAGKFMFDSSLSINTFEDLRATKKGLEYSADYSANFSVRSLVDKGYVDANGGAILYDNISATPLTKRSKYRAVEYIEFVDDAINEESKIQLRADSVTPSEVTRFGENGSGNVDLKIQEKKLPTGDVNGFATEYTASSECILGLDADSKIKEFEAVEIYNILKEDGITGDKQLALLDINGNSTNVKAKFEISAIVVQNTTANAVTINIGSTALGTDVVNAYALGANETKKLPLGTTFFSILTGQNLFISSGSWNSANINIHVTISKIWQ